MNVPLHLWLIPLAPFAGFLINGLLGRRLPKWLITTIALLAPLAAFGVVLNSALGFFGIGPGFSSLPYVESCPFSWLSIGPLHIDFTFVLDQLSLVMLLVVTGVGFLIHIYSVGYMQEDEGYARYFSYLNLFLFFMTVLVLAGNALLMFVGWEGVGLASYLLIGFWFQKQTAADAGKKAFIVNRIGDLGFLIGMFFLLANFGTLTFSEIATKLGQAPGWQGGVVTVIALCLLLGATGKSAQLPLYIWLPDAMEGPTPVSALIHAATMVTAGVYMIARTHVLFDHSPFALGTVAVVGAATALFAATIALVQNDIKRVLAYSTISQLGYMFLACGVAAYSAAIFHLVTHAFFKALLFLAAGAVIHAIGGEQDLRKMGGLRKKLPVTFWTMTVAVLAIAGFFPFAGFFSKDAILYAAFLQGAGGKALWFIGLLTALLTSFYMFRLWYLTFLGNSRNEALVSAHDAGSNPSKSFESRHNLGSSRNESFVTGHDFSRAEIGPEESEALAPEASHPIHSNPASMLVPLVILALLSICGGWIGIERFSAFLSPVVSVKAAQPGIPNLELILSIAAVAVALLGWFVADRLYRQKPARAAQLAVALPGGYKLLASKYYVDEFYGAIIVKPLLIVCRYLLGWFVDKALLGGAAWLLGGVATFAGALLQRWQSGNLRSYAAWLAAGAAAVLLFIVVPWPAVLASLSAIHFGVAGH